MIKKMFPNSNHLFEIEFDKVDDEVIMNLKNYIIDKIQMNSVVFKTISTSDITLTNLMVQDRTREFYFCDIAHVDDEDLSEFGTYSSSLSKIPKNLKYYQVYQGNKENTDPETHEPILKPIFIIKLFQNGELIFDPEFDPMFL